ncbi:thioredoxin domain [Streptomyces phage Wakanda]|uniref:Thioredoxin n=2 Tax=Wakandavirus TaxID=3044854 RepID=A0A6G8R3C3_9CAUD|nr:thioredoxin domain [Streptomyces phage Wakanda]YP_010652450.1 thioredoxin domain [Streptomyces phage Muntaha]QIN94129.1 thioredoxin [Streptomyces phage Wakanda]QIN94694.1 thioredoxin [Streptomyces phage Muntaha]
MASDAVVEVTTLDALHEILNKYSRVVVDFHAPAWCVPCRRLAPHIDVAAKKNENVRFVKVDVDRADQSIRDTFPIMSVPTVLYFEDGNQTKEIVGRTAIQILQELDS